jgi:hypothetical protein
MIGAPRMEAKHFSLFRLWLILFATLNVIDIVQTSLFFSYEANPLFALFPSVGFVLKILWTFLVPFVLYLFYPKNPQFVYFATFALVLLYLGIIITNLFSIARIITL